MPVPIPSVSSNELLPALVEPPSSPGGGGASTFDDFVAGESLPEFTQPFGAPGVSFTAPPPSSTFAPVASVPERSLTQRAADYIGRPVAELAAFAATELTGDRTPRQRADALITIKNAIGADDGAATQIVSSAFDRAGLTSGERAAVTVLLPFAKDGAVDLLAQAWLSLGERATPMAAAQVAASILGPLGFSSSQRSAILDDALARVPTLPADTKRQAQQLLAAYTPTGNQTDIGRIVDQIAAGLRAAPNLQEAAQFFSAVSGAYGAVEGLVGIFNGKEGSDDKLVSALQSLKSQGILSDDIANGASAAIRIYNAVQNAINFLGNEEGAGDKFLVAVNQLKGLGYLDTGTADAVLAAGSAYKTIQNTINAFGGEKNAAGNAVDGLNSLITQVLPATEAAKVTSSVGALKNAYTIVQNVVNNDEPNAMNKAAKAAAALFTNSTVFGGDFAKTASQIVAGYKLVQNVANFAQNESGAGQKALDAVNLLSSTGLISKDLSKMIQAAGATYKLSQNVINGLNGSNEIGNTGKAISAAQLLSNLGVLGPQVSATINTGIKAYTAIDSVVKLVQAPSLASGFGAVASIAGLIGGQTASTIANIATLGFGIATGGIGAIIGGVIGLLGGLFGGGKKFTEISSQLDANDDGRADVIRFEDKYDDFWYEIDASTLNVAEMRYYVTQTEKQDGQYYEFYGKVYRSGYDGDLIETDLDSAYDYNLNVSYSYHNFNHDANMWGLSSRAVVPITKAQRDQLAATGSLSANVGPGDARFEAVRQIAPPSGIVKAQQKYERQGMTWFADVNGDGIRDKITKYMDVRGESNGDNSTYIQLRNASGGVWMSYAVDANGNAGGGRASERANQVVLGGPSGSAGWRNVGGQTVYGSVDWGAAPLSAADQLTALRYIASNVDLMGAFGANANAGYQHMMEHGVAENRQVTFDSAAYLAANPDVAAAYGGSEIEATKHFIQWGYNENRALRVADQDVNGDGMGDRTLVYRDRTESYFTGSSGIQTVSIYDPSGQFRSSSGDFDNDGLRDQTTRLDSGDLRVETVEGAVRPVRVFGADGTLKEIVTDLNGDAVLDSVVRDVNGTFNASVSSASGTLVGSGGTMEIALAQAALSVPAERLKTLEYMASYPDLMNAFGMDVVQGYIHMTTHGIKENRSITFSADAYGAANADIAAAYGDDKIGMVSQYIQSGRNEGRVLKVVTGDANSDGFADKILIKADSVTIELKNASGATTKSVSGPSLEAAVAQANKTGLLTWIAGDDQRIITYGTDIVAAQRALSSNTAVGDPAASLDLFSFLVKEADRFTAANGNLDAVLTGFIDDRRTKSLESLALADGGYTTDLGATGWQQVSGAGGIFNPNADQVSMGAKTGVNVGYLNGNGVVARDIGAVEFGKLMSLVLSVTSRSDAVATGVSGGTFALRILSEGRVVGQQQYTAPPAGRWSQISLNIDGTTLPESLRGKPLTIQLIGTGAENTQLLFDDLVVKTRNKPAG